MIPFQQLNSAYIKLYAQSFSFPKYSPGGTLAMAFYLFLIGGFTV